ERSEVLEDLEEPVEQPALAVAQVVEEHAEQGALEPADLAAGGVAVVLRAAGLARAAGLVRALGEPVPVGGVGLTHDVPLPAGGAGLPGRPGLAQARPGPGELRAVGVLRAVGRAAALPLQPLDLQPQVMPDAADQVVARPADLLADGGLAALEGEEEA